MNLLVVLYMSNAASLCDSSGVTRCPVVVPLAQEPCLILFGLGSVWTL